MKPGRRGFGPWNKGCTAWCHRKLLSIIQGLCPPNQWLRTGRHTRMPQALRMKEHINPQQKTTMTATKIMLVTRNNCACFFVSVCLKGLWYGNWKVALLATSCVQPCKNQFYERSGPAHDPWGVCTHVLRDLEVFALT